LSAAITVLVLEGKGEVQTRKKEPFRVQQVKAEKDKSIVKHGII
jgi:hypothetical protein